MLQGWLVVAVALGYIGFLFVVASYGDRARQIGRSRLLIYPLSLAIYCTSWTFFGSVGLASRTGYDFLTIYVGPILMIGLGAPLIMRIVRLAKAQNITSIADFIAARYGKSQAVAATVALIAIVGTIPYIALQLKAVSSSLGTILTHVATSTGTEQPVFGDIAMFVALSMAAFAVLFGTRHIDATEHQQGLMLAIAVLVGVSYWSLVIADLALLIRIAAALVLAGSLVAVGTGIMHDANHGAYSSKKWINNMMGGTLNLVGAYNINWKIQHNIFHHTYTNIYGQDEDIRKTIIRFTPKHPYKSFHKFQWLYTSILYMIFPFIWILSKDFEQYSRYSKQGRAALNASLHFEHVKRIC